MTSQEQHDHGSENPQNILVAQHVLNRYLKIPEISGFVPIAIGELLLGKDEPTTADTTLQQKQSALSQFQQLVITRQVIEARRRQIPLSDAAQIGLEEIEQLIAKDEEKCLQDAELQAMILEKRRDQILSGLDLSRFGTLAIERIIAAHDTPDTLTRRHHSSFVIALKAILANI